MNLSVWKTMWTLPFAIRRLEGSTKGRSSFLTPLHWLFSFLVYLLPMNSGNPRNPALCQIWLNKSGKNQTRASIRSMWGVAPSWQSLSPLAGQGESIYNSFWSKGVPCYPNPLFSLWDVGVGSRFAEAWFSIPQGAFSMTRRQFITCKLVLSMLFG
jgi:hypothetical protein